MTNGQPIYIYPSEHHNRSVSLGAVAVIDHSAVMTRPYELIAKRLESLPDRGQQMQSFVDQVWDALRQTGVSWIGFYIHESDERLVLGPCRDRPACSPIGMQGVCGQVWTERQAMVVHDVTALGDHYIACDPRDRSEVVIPLIDESGRCWGVLDLDSRQIGAFSDKDVEGLRMLLLCMGLTHE